MDSWMMIVALGVGAMLVRVGVALYACGQSRSKNAAGAVVRTLCDLCVASLAFWALGAAVLLQEQNPYAGVDVGLLLLWNLEPVLSPQVFFYLVMVLIASSIFAGVVAERSTFFSLCGASVLLVGVLVPLAGQWVWAGWLRELGFIDVAGASVLHLTGAACAAAGALVIGPRTGKYNRDGSSNAIPGHSVPLTCVGVLTILVGWLPYVLGASILHDAPKAQVALNVLLSGAAGGAAGLLVGRLRYGKPEIFHLYGGVLGALVAISASAGFVGAPAAVAVGAVAGILVPLSAIFLDLACKLDDPTAGVAIHGVGGAWGLLAAGLFIPIGAVAKLQAAGLQLLGIAAVAAAAILASVAFFAVMKAFIPLRSREADEYDGLDLAEHDVNAYPDFQQTMIKSYHLREA